MNKLTFKVLILLVSMAFTVTAANYVHTERGLSFYDGVRSGPGELITEAEKQEMFKLLELADNENAKKYEDFVPNKSTLAVMKSLPDSIAGISSNGRIDSYEFAQNGLGYSKKYYSQEKAVNATVYSYHMRESVITAKKAAVQFEDAAIAIAESGLYSDIEVLDRSKAVYNGMEFMQMRLLINKKYLSSLYMAAYKNTYIKVRFDAGSEKASGIETAFINELTAVLK